MVGGVRNVARKFQAMRLSFANVLRNPLLSTKGFRSVRVVRMDAISQFMARLNFCVI